MADIRDIAREAGVSISAVSRVLNNQTGVRNEKREQVLKAIEKLNYLPNATARALVLKKTHTVGVVVKEISSIYFAEFVRELHYQTDGAGYGALYCNRNNFIRTKIDYLTILNKLVDGFFFLGEHTISREELTLLSKHNYPLITINFDLNVPQVTSIAIDNVNAASQAVSYLISLGHQRILNISGPENDSDFRERSLGYTKALRNNDMKIL